MDKPAPTSSGDNDRLLAVSLNSFSIAAGVASGDFSQRRARIPATWGVAMLVPEMMRFRNGIGHDE